MLLECGNCEYRWDYAGDAEKYATCPRCRYKVNIEKQRVDDGDNRDA